MTPALRSEQTRSWQGTPRAGTGRRPFAASAKVRVSSMENDVRANQSLERAGQGQILSRGPSKERVRGAWISWACAGKSKSNRLVIQKRSGCTAVVTVIDVYAKAWFSKAVCRPSVASDVSVMPCLVWSGVSELQCAS